jgi:WD40 repeat protein
MALVHPDQVQSFAWKSDGSRLVSSCKDGVVRIWDPRNSIDTPVAVGNRQF